MMTEIVQIKKWLAKKFRLRTEGEGMYMRIIDPVPEGEYMIPIGTVKPITKSKVRINGGFIQISMKDPDIKEFIRHLEGLDFEQLCSLAAWCLMCAAKVVRSKQ